MSQTQIDSSRMAQEKLAELEAELAAKSGEQAEGLTPVATRYSVEGVLQATGPNLITDLRYPDGPLLDFRATAWGIAFPTTPVSGAMNLPWQGLLALGDQVHFQIVYSAVVGVQITFWDPANRPIGVLVGESLGIGGGSGGGEGQFIEQR